MPPATAPLAANVEPIAVPINAASRISGVGRTKIYEAIGAGDLASCLIGRRRLILVDDLREWLRRQRRPVTDR